jgi:drug/metabolite transporter (DMT)-like permease
MVFYFVWAVWTIIFVVAQVAFLQLFKFATRNSRDLGNLTVAVQLITAVSILIFIPFFPWLFPFDFWNWFLLVVSFLFYAINDRLDATTRKNLDISVDTMLHQTYRIFFLAFGILFLQRPFVWLKLMGALIIVAANLLLFFERGKFRFNKYVWLKILSSFIFAAAFAIDNYHSMSFNLPFFVFLSFICPAVYLMLARQATPRGIMREIRRREWWAIVVAGIVQGIMTLAILRAYQFHDKLIEVAVVSSVFVILNVFAAVLFLGERRGLVRKFAAGAIIVGSIVFVILV